MAEAGILADRRLVDDCLTQGGEAWSRLYAACHDSLMAAIRSFLRGMSADVDLIDEIAARVWYALVKNDYELLARFDVTRGCRLTTFLSMLAKSETRQYFRSERRRKHREATASRPEADYSGEAGSTGLYQEEFVTCLSPSERTFYENVLLSDPLALSERTYSQENAWQLRHRVRKKLHLFLA
jgi:DNA-directed RNA polymerase specialized sigma24 family protein